MSPRKPNQTIEHELLWKALADNSLFFRSLLPLSRNGAECGHTDAAPRTGEKKAGILHLADTFEISA